MTRRASLPGAEELFRRTADGADQMPVDQGESISPPVVKSPFIQMQKEIERREQDKPRHDEKITFYCTGAELMRLERARLNLRAEHGVAADRGRIVRAALEEMLEDFEVRGASSGLVKRLQKPAQ